MEARFGASCGRLTRTLCCRKVAPEAHRNEGATQCLEASESARHQGPSTIFSFPRRARRPSCGSFWSPSELRLHLTATGNFAPRLDGEHILLPKSLCDPCSRPGHPTRMEMHSHVRCDRMSLARNRGVKCDRGVAWNRMESHGVAWRCEWKWRREPTLIRATDGMSIDR